MRPSSGFTTPHEFRICVGKGLFKERDPERSRKSRGGETRRRMAGNQILLIGKLRELALYRAEVLRERGFEVKLPVDAKEAVTEINRGSYDVAVLSYTLQNDEVQRMAELIRQSCPDCPVVTISTSGRPDRRVNPDETVLADDGPAGLIKVLSRLRRVH